MQLAHDVMDQLAQLCGRHLGAFRYVGGGEGNEVVRRDQGLVERGQQVGIRGGVEVGQDMQQVGHGWCRARARARAILYTQQRLCGGCVPSSRFASSASQPSCNSAVQRWQQHAAADATRASGLTKGS